MGIFLALLFALIDSSSGYNQLQRSSQLSSTPLTPIGFYDSSNKIKMALKKDFGY